MKPMGDRVWTISDILRWTNANLSSDMSLRRSDYERLLCHVLGLSRVELYTNYQMPVAVLERESFKALLQECKRGVPIPYLTGLASFYGRDFCVSPDVLIPRPDTECLVEAVLAITSGGEGFSVIDIGSGSGCIAITLAKELAVAKVIGVDICPKSLAVAKQNSLYHEADVMFCEIDFLGAGLEEFGKVDLVVSNPPYIPQGAISSLDPSVCEHEPHLALDGGSDGLRFYSAMAISVHDSLVPGGHLVLEVGYDQGESVPALLEASGWCDVNVKQDYAGRDRVVVAKKPEESN